MQQPTTAPAPPPHAPDLAERWAWRLTGWRIAHPGASRALAIAQPALAAVAIVTLLIAAILDEPFRQAYAQALLFLVPVAVVLLVTRTRGIDARFALRWLLVSALAAPLIAATAWGVAAVAGQSISSDGATVAVASIVEEVGKLVPFAILALVATNRVRRFTTTDYLVVGWLSGMGFSIVEEPLRLTAIHSSGGLARLDAILGDADPRLVLSPLLTSYGGDPSPLHPVWTALVLGALGLGIELARRTAALRFLIWLLPLVAGLAAILDHAMGNTGSEAWDMLTGDAHLVAKALAVPWLLTAQGVLLHVLLVLLWIAAAVLDADRRAMRGSVTTATLERMRRIAGRGRLGRALAAGAGLAMQVVDDAIAWGRGCASALRSGLRIASVLLPIAHGANAAARAEPAALPPLDAAGQRALRRRILRALVVVVVPALVAAGLLCVAIEAVPMGERFWLLGILEAISDWWNDLSPLTQGLLIAGGLALLGGVGLTGLVAMSALRALTIMSWATFGLTYTGPLVRVVRDPGRMADYLRTTAPRDIMVDVITMVLASPIGFRSPALAKIVSRRIDDLTPAQAAENITAIVDTIRLMAPGQVAEGFIRTLEDLAYALRHPQPVWPAPGWKEGITGP